MGADQSIEMAHVMAIQQQQQKKKRTSRSKDEESAAAEEESSSSSSSSSLWVDTDSQRSITNRNAKTACDGVPTLFHVGHDLCIRRHKEQRRRYRNMKMYGGAKAVITTGTTD